MIGIRSIVKFVSKHRDQDRFIVREIRYDGKVLIQSVTDDSSYFVVPVADVESCQ